MVRINPESSVMRYTVIIDGDSDWSRETCHSDLSRGLCTESLTSDRESGRRRCIHGISFRLNTHQKSYSNGNRRLPNTCMVSWRFTLKTDQTLN